MKYDSKVLSWLHDSSVVGDFLNYLERIKQKKLFLIGIVISKLKETNGGFYKILTMDVVLTQLSVRDSFS